MPIPELNTHGLLPPGVHDCTVGEITERFGAFQGGEQRPRLMEKLIAFAAEARASGIVRALLVDGSFVTAKPAPNDMDLIVIVAGTHDFSADLRPLEYNVVSKRRVRQRYGFDILVAREDSPEHGKWVEFFEQVRLEPEARKGILWLRL